MSEWGDPDASLDAAISSSTLIPKPANDIPLQYRNLWAGAAPKNAGGHVSPKALATILAQAGITGTPAARILVAANARTDSIDETSFYIALASAARVQAGGPAPGDAINAKSDAMLDTAEDVNNLEYQELNLGPAPEPEISADHLVYDPLSPDTIRVTVREELEGSFMFRHVVYAIEGTYNDTSIRVIRRYRDFAWLLERLVAKYPFRTIPTLPPKRLTMNGRFLSADAEFTEHRRMGLVRFCNLLAKHPVVGKDELVRAFLTLNSPGETLRARYAASSKAKITELDGKVIEPLFIAQFDAAEYSNRLTAMRNGSEAALLAISNMGHILERRARRYDTEASEAGALVEVSRHLSEALPKAYYDKREDLAAFSSGLSAVGAFATGSASEDARASTRFRAGTLEETKKFRDMMVAVRELFNRYDSQGGNDIPKLERRIESLRTQIANAATKPDVSEDLMMKLHRRVKDAQSLIKAQTNRDWLIKKLLVSELVMIQTTQYQLGVFLRSLGREMISDTDAASELAKKLNSELETLPVSVT